MLTAIEARGRTLENSLSKNKIRLRNPATGEYLHLSGTGTTRTTAYAWLGCRYQAAVIKQRATQAGQPWPYHPMHRSIIDTAHNHPDPHTGDLT